MALSQRAASRFFAVFYRWNSHKRKPCALPSQSGRAQRYPTSSYSPRSYHTTCLVRQRQFQDSLRHRDVRSFSKDAVNILREFSEQNEDVTTSPIPITESVEPPNDTPDLGLKPQKLKHALRDLMRSVPSSVAVITVASVDPDSNKHVPMGVAVSSLSSVTLDPPTVSFNIKHPSKTLNAIRTANGRFRIHFPEADHGGARVAELFCRGNHADAYSMREKELSVHVPSHEHQARSSPSYAPQIQHDSIRAALECVVTHQLPVADHVILVARVDSLEQKTSRESTIMYVKGTYMRCDGSTITSHVNSAVEVR